MAMRLLKSFDISPMLFIYRKGKSYYELQWIGSCVDMTVHVLKGHDTSMMMNFHLGFHTHNISTAVSVNFRCVVVLDNFELLNQTLYTILLLPREFEVQLLVLIVLTSHERKYPLSIENTMGI